MKEGKNYVYIEMGNWRWDDPIQARPKYMIICEVMVLDFPFKGNPENFDAIMSRRSKMSDLLLPILAPKVIGSIDGKCGYSEDKKSYNGLKKTMTAVLRVHAYTNASLDEIAQDLHQRITDYRIVIRGSVFNFSGDVSA
jgi:hypothetical protein